MNLRLLLTMIFLLSANFLRAQVINTSGTFDFAKDKIIHTSFTASNGTEYKIGDHITAVPASDDNSITRKFIFHKENVNKEEHLENNESQIVRGEIRKIVAYGDKKNGYSIYFVIKPDTSGNSGNKLIFFEDDAVRNLVKAKNKLKSGLISAEEYEELKKN